MPFTPGDPWPGTPGGAAHYRWGGYTRFYLQAQIAAGRPFRMGPDPDDRLDAGNVMSRPGGFPLEAEARAVSSYWVDLTCDVMDCEITLGSSAGQGILSKADAGTLTATFYDPDGIYDPANSTGPYALGGQTRLQPMVPVRAWTEIIVDPAAATPTVATYPLFYGTADRWQSGWQFEPSDRRTKLVATDPTKLFVKSDKPASGASAVSTVIMRLNGIIFNMGWPNLVQGYGPPTVAILASTQYAQPAWEQVNRTMDDELGMAWFRPLGPTETGAGELAFTGRAQWTTPDPPTVTIGCGPGWYDIATAVTPASFDSQLVNSVYAARTGGTQQTAQNSTSMSRWGEQTIKRTDLGLNDDAQVAVWAQTLVNLYAFPQTSLDNITVQPDVDPAPWDAWQAVLAVPLVTGVIRVVYDQGGYDVDVNVRLVGWTQHIGTDGWEVEWRTIASSLTNTAAAFTMGPDARDRLDSGFLLA